MRLVLASRSPRRADLLTRMGLRFTVVAADVDESPHANEAPADYVRRLALDKASAVAQPDAVTVGADTVVVLDGEILGKPRNREQATAMLLALGGRWHQVVTGVAVVAAAGSQRAVVTSDVHFRPVEPAEAQAYARTGEGADKAGGYGIQGIGGIFVDSIRGSYSAVVGLPIAETEALLRRMGLDTWRERTTEGGSARRPQSERTDG